MNSLKIIEQFQKDAIKLNRDANSVEEFKMWWLEARKVAAPIEWREEEFEEETETPMEEEETPVEDEVKVEPPPVRVKKEEPKEKKPEKFYVLNTASGISTAKPLDNEYVNDWDENQEGNGPETYLLIRSEKYSRPWILSGSGAPEGYEVGDKVALFDDINETTPFARYKGPGQWVRGTPGEILAIAGNANEIKNFPKGRYRLMVMK